MPRWLLGLDARMRYFALAVGTMALGLAVHWGGGALSPALRDILGDALWAAMVSWWMAAAAPALRLSRRAGAAIAFCFAVEFSQLYHAPALDAIRRTTAGHLVLGSGFDPRDQLDQGIRFSREILLTGTHSVGTVRDAAIQWQLKNGREFVFTYPDAGAARPDGTPPLSMLPNERIDPLFQATIDATEEAAVNAMLAAQTMTGADGIRVFGLPGDRVVDVLRKYNRMK
jgi:Protein of unknown function (DUF2809)/Peptidase family S58